MNDLIAKLEAATEGSRELDGRIMFMLYAKPVGERGYIWPEDNPSWSFALAFDAPVSEKVKERDRRDAIREGRAPNEWIEFQHDGKWILMNDLRVPRLTTSLDAALTLVPDGKDWVVSRTFGRNSNLFGAFCEPGYWERAPTAALALCIAALMARQATGGGK